MAPQSISTRRVILTLLTLGSLASAQVTLTGCHIHEGQEVCLLPGGVETTIAQAAAAPSPTSPVSVNAQTTTTDPAAQTTAITDCHQHDTTQYCVKGDGGEVQVLLTATGTAPLPSAYTGCHAHATAMYCIAPDGSEVETVAAALDEDEEEHTDESETGEDCHFHAGVEHCVGGTAEASETKNCERKDRDYNVNLRVALLFVVLVTSAIAVYMPLFITRVLRVKVNGTIFAIVKQFGTGIIIATALIHLITHAQLMFANECLIGGTGYEATPTAIVMGGAFLAFLIDFVSHRLGIWRLESVNERQAASISSGETPVESPSKMAESPEPSNLAALSHHHGDLPGPRPNDALSVCLLEAGIIFHSILIGITLVVAPDSVFITLFIVIVFHQMFEGLALGARIAAIEGQPKVKYIILPTAFALVTPLGMGIGIAVLNQFNGNDPSTIIAIGTLDALSAGILLWVGVVGMWAQDWMYGEMRHASLLKTVISLLSLMGGMILMGVLGKWA